MLEMCMITSYARGTLPNASCVSPIERIEWRAQGIYEMGASQLALGGERSPATGPVVGLRKLLCKARAGTSGELADVQIFCAPGIQ